MLSYLSIERQIARSLKGQEAFIELPPGRRLTVTQKIFILIVSVVSIMATAILLMVLLDVYYLIGQDFSQPEIFWGIFKEIAFALCVLLGVSLVIVYRFAQNLREILDTQLAAMDEISRGNLAKQVPILSSDEFARIAEKTNQMMEGLKERDFCRTSFDQYVSPEVSRKILDDTIAPTADLIDVSVLFCDIRNYTGFAEKHSPREIVDMLNHYFTAMERVIRLCPLSFLPGLCGWCEGPFKKVVNGPGTFSIEVTGAGTDKGFVGDDRRIRHPGVLLPGKPRLLVLVIHMDGAIEKFGQFNPPAGAALDRVIRLNPADGKHVIAFVDHVEDRLDHLANPVGPGISPAHAQGDDLHADVALVKFVRTQEVESPGSLHRVAFE